MLPFFHFNLSTKHQNEISCSSCRGNHAVGDCNIETLKCITLKGFESIHISANHTACDIVNCTAYGLAKDIPHL